jgi:hypothetical protein
MSNIHGLGPVGGDKKKDDKKTEEFSGGGAQSNTAVQRKVKDGVDINDILGFEPLATFS